MNAFLIRHRSCARLLGAALTVALISPLALGGDDDAARAASHPALTVPAAFELGDHRAQTPVPGRVWVINRSDVPLHLKKIKGTCGCIKVKDFEPVILAAHTAMPVDFSITAPKTDGMQKTKKLTMHFENQEPLHVALSIGADNAAPVAEFESTEDVTHGIIATPGVVTFGEVDAGTVTSGEAWLINTGSDAQEIVSAKGACGCITMHDFAPLTLGPLEARLVTFDIKTPKKAGKNKATSITFVVADGAPLELPITMHAAGASRTEASVASRD